MNMYLLYVLGRMLEPELGPVQMLAVYVTSLLAGSLGAIILEPSVPSAGASGAIFGLMGMTLVVARSRGLSEAVKQIGVLVVINLVITFGYSGISKGAHLGGLIGGALCGLILFELGERRGWLGRVFEERYHARVLKTKTEIQRVLVYLSDRLGREVTAEEVSECSVSTASPV